MGIAVALALVRGVARNLVAVVGLLEVGDVRRRLLVLVDQVGDLAFVLGNRERKVAVGNRRAEDRTHSLDERQRGLG